MPRLTAVLRGLAHDPASSFDPDAAFIERQKALAARQQQQQQQSGSSDGGGAAGGQQRSKLAQQLLGDWSKGEPICHPARVVWCLPVDRLTSSHLAALTACFLASAPSLLLVTCTPAAPKAAREEYELYLQAVAGLLGGDLASEELQEAAAQVCWAVPKPHSRCLVTCGVVCVPLRPEQTAVCRAAVGTLNVRPSLQRQTLKPDYPPCTCQVWSAMEPLPAPDKLPAAGHLQQRELASHTAALLKLEATPPRLAQAAVAKLILQVRCRGGVRVSRPCQSDNSACSISASCLEAPGSCAVFSASTPV